MHRGTALLVCALSLSCGRDAQQVAIANATPTATPTADGGSVAVATPGGISSAAAREANELGRNPIFEYHLIGDSNATYMRTHGGMRRDLEYLYEQGFRPVSVAELVDRKLDLAAGLSPAVFVFDDASPSQFRYLERNGRLEIDPTSAVGIWLDFAKTHPDWRNRAVFCMLSGAEVGRSFFGNKDIEGQKTEWRFPKVKFLHEQGFELCNHTLWHARLDKYPDAFVQEQIARLQMAIDSAVTGAPVRTLALPLGKWPKNRALAQAGSWRDPKSGRVVSYRFDAVLEVAGGPARSPYDPAFDPLSLPRVQVIGDSAVARTVRQLDGARNRYVSDGDPSRVTRGAATAVSVQRSGGSGERSAVSGQRKRVAASRGRP